MMIPLNAAVEDNDGVESNLIIGVALIVVEVVIGTAFLISCVLAVVYIRGQLKKLSKVKARIRLLAKATSQANLWGSADGIEAEQSGREGRTGGCGGGGGGGQVPTKQPDDPTENSDVDAAATRAWTGSGGGSTKVVPVQ
jgi:hypothetical protein